jgi:hypothetical protein
MDYIELQEDVNKGLARSDILLSGTKVLTESSRESPEYQDSRYLPFYYHLGKQVAPRRVVEIGPKLGLPAACFLQSCKSVEMWFALGNPVAEQSRISKSNISLHLDLTEDDYSTVTVMGLMKELMQKELPDVEWPIDLALVTEDFGGDVKIYMEFLWKYLESEGLLVCDYIDSDAQGEAFMDFCKTKNRTPVGIQTRYGVGIIER